MVLLMYIMYRKDRESYSTRNESFTLAVRASMVDAGAVGGEIAVSLEEIEVPSGGVELLSVLKWGWAVFAP